MLEAAESCHVVWKGDARLGAVATLTAVWAREDNRLGLLALRYPHGMPGVALSKLKFVLDRFYVG